MATTDCRVCGTVEQVSASEHLERMHLNEFFEMETDPATDHTVIEKRHGILEVGQA